MRNTKTEEFKRKKSKKFWKSWRIMHLWVYISSLQKVVSPKYCDKVPTLGTFRTWHSIIKRGGATFFTIGTHQYESRKTSPHPSQFDQTDGYVDNYILRTLGVDWKDSGGSWFMSESSLCIGRAGRGFFVTYSVGIGMPLAVLKSFGDQFPQKYFQYSINFLRIFFSIFYYFHLPWRIRVGARNILPKLFQLR